MTAETNTHQKAPAQSLMRMWEAKKTTNTGELRGKMAFRQKGMVIPDSAILCPRTKTHSDTEKHPLSLPKENKTECPSLEELTIAIQSEKMEVEAQKFTHVGNCLTLKHRRREK